MPINTTIAIITAIRIKGLSGPEIGNNGFGLCVAVAVAVGEGLGVGVCRYLTTAVGLLGVDTGTGMGAYVPDAWHAIHFGSGSQGSSGSVPIIISFMLQ